MKNRIILFCSLLMIFSLFGCRNNQNTGESPKPTSPSTEAATVQDYFPILENVRYIYAGEGNEYAAYDVYIDYASDNKIQQRVSNGGTVLAKVLEVGNGKITLILSQEESYARENYLDKTDEAPEILLMEPIEAGTTWTLSDGRVRTITEVSVNVETPSGAYSAVAVETKTSSGTNTDYYAKNIGLIKTVFAGEDFEVSSTLSEIQEDVPLVQSVRFFYPSINDGKIYYKNQELSLKTNDITKKAFEAAYKQPFDGQPGKVFSENTIINSFYLNQDGMVYLDLSKDFVTEMNAGSEYEALLLQCLANTFGSYYNAEKVILTIDGSPYESGHIKLEKGEYLSVNTDGNIEIS